MSYGASLESLIHRIESNLSRGGALSSDFDVSPVEPTRMVGKSYSSAVLSSSPHPATPQDQARPSADWAQRLVDLEALIGVTSHDLRSETDKLVALTTKRLEREISSIAADAAAVQRGFEELRRTSEGQRASVEAAIRRFETRVEGAVADSRVDAERAAAEAVQTTNTRISQFAADLRAIQRLETRVEAAESGLRSALPERQAMSEELDALTRKVTTLESRALKGLGDLEAEIRTAGQEPLARAQAAADAASDARAAVRALQLECGNFVSLSTYTDDQQLIRNIQLGIEELQERIIPRERVKLVEQKLVSSTGKIDSIESRCDDIEHQLTLLSSTFERRAERLDDISTRIQDQFDSLRSQVQDSGSIVSKVSRELKAELDPRLDSVEDLLSAFGTRVSKIDKKASDAFRATEVLTETAIAPIEIQLQNQQEQFTELLDSFERFKTELATDTQTISARQSAGDEFQSYVMSELDALKSLVEDLEHEVQTSGGQSAPPSSARHVRAHDEDLEARIVSLESGLAELKSHMGTLIESLGMVSDKLDHLQSGRLPIMSESSEYDELSSDSESEDLTESSLRSSSSHSQIAIPSIPLSELPDVPKHLPALDSVETPRVDSAAEARSSTLRPMKTPRHTTPLEPVPQSPDVLEKPSADISDQPQSAHPGLDPSSKVLAGSEPQEQISEPSFDSVIQTSSQAFVPSSAHSIDEPPQADDLGMEDLDLADMDECLALLDESDGAESPTFPVTKPDAAMTPQRPALSDKAATPETHEAIPSPYIMTPGTSLFAAIDAPTDPESIRPRASSLIKDSPRSLTRLRQIDDLNTFDSSSDDFDSP